MRVKAHTKMRKCLGPESLRMGSIQAAQVTLRHYCSIGLPDGCKLRHVLENKPWEPVSKRPDMQRFCRIACCIETPEVPYKIFQFFMDRVLYIFHSVYKMDGLSNVA